MLLWPVVVSRGGGRLVGWVIMGGGKRGSGYSGGGDLWCCYGGGKHDRHREDCGDDS